MITNELLKDFKDRFQNDKASTTIANAIAKAGVQDSSFNNDVLRFHNFKFSDTVKKGEVTHQKHSGRCWMFAGFNVLRLQVIKKLNVKNFEFSETYLYFMDKMEKSNSFLTLMIEHADEPLDSRLMQEFIKHGGAGDGSWFEGFEALISKYGCVPKYIMPETYNSENSAAFVDELNYRLKRSAMRIRQAHEAGKSTNELEKIKEDTLYEIYNICTKVLGKLPETFDFEYTDKDDKFHKVPNLTPMKFYEEYVGDYFANKINLIDDPRGVYPYGKRLELKYSKIIQEKRSVSSLNVPQEDIKKAVIQSIKDGEAVWFACDVHVNTHRKSGIMDSKLYNYNDTLTDLGELTRAERIDYHHTELNHAMSFIGVDLDENGNPIKWQVENSWGDKLGEKGIFSMSDEWFTNENIVVIVEKKYIDEKWLKGLDEDPIMLEMWDPYAIMLKGNLQ